MSVARQELRHIVSVPGRYRSGRGVPKAIEVLDLSEHGCRFFDRFGTLKIGAEISVRIGSIGPIVSNVRWSNNSVVGVEFAEPIYGPVMEFIRDKLSANRI